MFAIVLWKDPQNARFVFEEKGGVKLFETHAEAESFAESELNSNWIVMEL